MREFNFQRLLVSLFFASVFSTPALADEAKTYGEDLSAPVFERIDDNGVDLLSGFLRVRSPVLTSGSEDDTQILGLEWTGRGWRHLGVPTIWRKDGTYTVNYEGYSDEFKGRSHDYAQKKPINGADLSCLIFEPGNLAGGCVYTSRDGDVVQFLGLLPYANPGSDYGILMSKLGNLGMYYARTYTHDRPLRYHGSLAYPGHIPGVSVDDEYPYKRNVTIRRGELFLKIETPNHNNDWDEHYLRPKSTTQSIEDPQGSKWYYQVNSDREIARITPPAGAAAVTYTYTSGHRVKTATTGDGVWNYTYTTPGNYITVTRTDPHGKSIYVKAHKDRGYITEYRDELNRWTYYTYDSGYRLTEVRYPEQNRLQFTYDARGNITQRRQVGKSGQVLTTQAIFQAQCDPSPTCNKPTATIDANGKRTDYEYAPVADQGIPLHSYVIPTKSGYGRPTKITLPAPVGGAVRPQIRNTFSGGVMTETALCKTQSSCAGGNDEVKTTYQYGSGGTVTTNKLLFGTVVSNAGSSLRTCYSYNKLGRRISETPPRANLSSCSESIAPTPGENNLVTGTPRVSPTYPGVSGGGTPPGGGGPPDGPPDCGGNPCP